MKTSCSPAGDNYTNVRVSAKIYPWGTEYVQEDLKKLCFYTPRSGVEGDMSFDEDWSDALDTLLWEFFIASDNMLYVESKNGSVKTNDQLSASIGDRFHALSYPGFWKKAYKALTPEYLQSMGYETCEVNYPNYYPVNRLGSQITCYCSAKK